MKLTIIIKKKITSREAHRILNDYIVHYSLQRGYYIKIDPLLLKLFPSKTDLYSIHENVMSLSREQLQTLKILS